MCVLAFFLRTLGSKLRDLAWKEAAKSVQEAVASISAGRVPSLTVEDATLTNADAITLRQLGGSKQEYIEKLVGPNERSAKPRTISLRILKVVKAAKAVVYHGFGKLDSGSVLAFLRSPMRAQIPKIAQAPRTDKITNGSIVRPGRKEHYVSDVGGDHSRDFERSSTRGKTKRLRADEQQDGEDQEKGSTEAGLLLMQLSKVAKRIDKATLCILLSSQKR